MFRYLAPLIFIAVFYLVLAQDVQLQPMPEPTSVYACGEDFQPVDIEFDGNGNLYSTDRQLLSGYNPWYNPDSPIPEQERINSIYRYQKDTSECQTILSTGVSLK